MGDFLGFTFGGVHSSELGITRVSGGDRYTEELFPEMRDRTAEVPGVNGEYYFGSDYGPRSFSIDIAYDSLTEVQFKRLRQIFGTNEIRELIFDECPYKRYLVKNESPIELSYVCFDEPKRIRYSEKYPTLSLEDYPDGIRIIVEENEGEEIRVKEKIDPWIYEGGIQRIYKGEGTISLIAYFPFAKSVFKVVPSEEEESDWVLSSGILTQRAYNNAHIDEYRNTEESGVGIITVHNPGDVATGFRLYLPGSALTSNRGTLIHYFVNSISTAKLKLNPITLETGDVGILIDTNTGLITGVSVAPEEDQDHNWQYTTSGNLYNKYIDSGYFFKIEPNMRNTYDYIAIGYNADINMNIQIFYDYLYF